MKWAITPVCWTLRFKAVTLETEEKTELEQGFGYCDQSTSVWVTPIPSGFAFLKFEDLLDAADSVCEVHGGTLYGCQGRAELSNSGKKKVEIKACLLLDPQDDFLTW